MSLFMRRRRDEGDDAAAAAAAASPLRHRRGPASSRAARRAAPSGARAAPASVLCDLCLDETTEALVCGGEARAAHGVCLRGECLVRFVLNARASRGARLCCTRAGAGGDAGCAGGAEWTFDELRAGMERAPPSPLAAEARAALLYMEALPLIEAARAEGEAVARAEAAPRSVVARMVDECTALVCPNCAAPFTVTEEGECLVGLCDCKMHMCTCCFETGTRAAGGMYSDDLVHRHIELCRANVFPGGFFGADKQAQLCAARAFALARFIRRTPAVRAALATDAAFAASLGAASDESVRAMEAMGLVLPGPGDMPVPVLTGRAAAALPRIILSLAAEQSGEHHVRLCQLNESGDVPALTAQLVDLDVANLAVLLARRAGEDVLVRHFQRLYAYSKEVYYSRAGSYEARFVLYVAARHHAAALQAAADSKEREFFDLICDLHFHGLPGAPEAEAWWKKAVNFTAHTGAWSRRVRLAHGWRRENVADADLDGLWAPFLQPAVAAAGGAAGDDAVARNLGAELAAVA